MKKWIICVVVALGFSLLTPSSFGYVVDLGIYGYPGVQVKWNDADLPVTYDFNLSGAPAGASTALQNAWQAWEDECRSYMDFSYGGTTTGTGAFTVSWGDLGAGTIAVNNLTFNTSAGRLISTRITFNTDFTWSATATCPPGAMDVQNIATHEFGHTLCLADLYLPAAANGAKTMYGWGSAGETQKRTLEQDDRDGVVYFYPNNPNERVWIKDATDDYGCTPYPTDHIFWESPDIRVVPNPPAIGEPATIYVTARNMMPTDQTADITVEVERYTGVEPMFGAPYKWTNTLYSQTIPAAGNTLIEGKQEFSFSWTVEPSDFDEGHYCIVAAVQTSGDVVTNPWAPLDNDVAHHNINIIRDMSPGARTFITFNAGNPTGEDVIMTLHFDRSKLPKGWEARFEQFPEDEPIPLRKGDTLLPIRMVFIPMEKAEDGEYAPVIVSSKLERPGTGEQIGGGGITFRGVVGKPHDVGVLELGLPPEEVDVGTIVTPEATFKNFGSYDETFLAVCGIGADYFDTTEVKLAIGESKPVSFKDWKATSSSPVTVTAIHPMDAYPENNILHGTVLVKGFADSLELRGINETKKPVYTFELSASRPNPFTSTTVISYVLPYSAFVGLKVYNPTGKLVRTLTEKHEKAGAWSLTWDGTDNAGVKVGNGVYFIRFETPTYKAIQKLVLVK